MTQIQKLRIHHYLLVFRAGTAAALGVTSTLAAAVGGGVLRRAIQAMFGTAAWATPMGLQPVTATVRDSGSLLGV